MYLSPHVKVGQFLFVVVVVGEGRVIVVVVVVVVQYALIIFTYRILANLSHFLRYSEDVKLKTATISYKRLGILMFIYKPRCQIKSTFHNVSSVLILVVE
jgi:hypothetical protein